MIKKQKYVIIGLAVILVISGAFLVWQTFFDSKSATFRGTITAEGINCILADESESIYVDDKKVVLDPGNTADRGAVGSASSGLTPCNEFDINSVETDGLGIPLNNQEDGGEGLIGHEVEIHAAELPDGSYTLQGDSDYYVKAIE